MRSASRLTRLARAGPGHLRPQLPIAVAERTAGERLALHAATLRQIVPQEAVTAMS